MSNPSLRERFAELQAERERTWTLEQLERNAHQRRILVERHAALAQLKPGTTLAPFALIDQDGVRLTSEALTASGPAVLVFFRFGGCPACNLALPHYNRTLWPQLRKAGIPMVAVSAQLPVDLSIIERHALGFIVAGDPDYALTRSLGITFLPEEQPAVVPGEDWIGAKLGTNSYEIAQPAVLILDQGNVVRWFDVSPDWLIRSESDTILAQLSEVTAVIDAKEAA
jgi:peroxiredoxin